MGRCEEHGLDPKSSPHINVKLNPKLNLNANLNANFSANFNANFSANFSANFNANFNAVTGRATGLSAYVDRPQRLGSNAFDFCPERAQNGFGTGPTITLSNRLSEGKQLSVSTTDMRATA